MNLTFFAACPKGLEYLLRDELRELGADDAREALAGVHFSGDFALAMRACLWSRLASRVLLVLSRFSLNSADELYENARQLPWHSLLTGPRGAKTFAIDVSGSAPGIAHTGFAGLRVKDAIVDSFREAGLDRPNVDTAEPQVRLRAYLHARDAALMWDLSGAALHERGWRTGQGAAPIKENLAAAMLLRAGWRERAQAGEAMFDPMCGAGTLLIEAAWMLADVAPGLLRARLEGFGFIEHPDFAAQPWDAQLLEANARAEVGLKALGGSERLFGYDADAQVLSIAKRNLQSARVQGFVRLANCGVAQVRRPPHVTSGLLLSNPPYGERMGSQRSLFSVYQDFGNLLKQEFAGFGGALISSDAELLSAVNLPIRKRYALKNGALDCTLAIYDSARAPRSAKALSPGAQMVANRLEKNLKKLKTYVRDQQLECYRIYDADLPEYSAAIDVYGTRLHIQEYQAPAIIPVETTQARLQELVTAAMQVFNCERGHVYLKTRLRDKGGSKYEQQANSDEFFAVAEGDLKFWVNLEDYLDTGLFLDSRWLRQQLRLRAAGKRVLNLFCYTGSASVYAAAGGALATVSVDLSPTYMEWTERNFELNRINPRNHHFIEGDAVGWLRRVSDRFDLIYLDPPTFSNSKRTPTVLDIQRDHAELITLAMRLLTADGELIFVTNAQKFKLDPTIAEHFALTDISARSLPLDFARNPKIHRAYLIQHSAAAIQEGEADDLDAEPR